MGFVSSADEERTLKDLADKDESTAKELIVAAQNLLVFAAAKQGVKPGEEFECPYLNDLDAALQKADAWW